MAQSSIWEIRGFWSSSNVHIVFYWFHCRSHLATWYPVWIIPVERMTSESIYKLFILRNSKKHLPALYGARACTLTEWSASGLGICARSLRCKAKQSTLLYISETFPTDFLLFEVFLGQGYNLVCSIHLKKREKVERLKEGRKTQAIFLFPQYFGV